MKLKIFSFSAVCLFFLNANMFAQKTVGSCHDINISEQAEALKKSFAKQGMIVFQEAMLQMTSMEPAPIVVRLQQGISYQFIYIGNETASRIIMEVFDGRNKKTDEKIERGSDNSIVYRFTPPATDNYLITLIQKKGTKDMCGYFGIMTKGPKSAIASSPALQKQPAPQPKPEPVNTSAPQGTSVTAPEPQTVKERVKQTENKDRLPANQIPNQNRLKATRQAQEGTK